MIDFLIQHIWFIPLYGLLGAILSFPWALGFIRKTGPRPAAYVNILMTLIAVIHGTIIFFNLTPDKIQTLDIHQCLLNYQRETKYFLLAQSWKNLALPTLSHI